MKKNVHTPSVFPMNGGFVSVVCGAVRWQGWAGVTFSLLQARAVFEVAQKLFSFRFRRKNLF